MRICIAGGGALGHVIAGYIARVKGLDVSILTRHPQDWNQSLNVFTPEGETIPGHLDCVTSDPSEACNDADIVLICLPGFAIEEELKNIAPHLNRRTWVGSVVCSSGFFFDAFKILDTKQPLFGFQRVPFISRVKEYGHSAMMLGRRSSLNIAVEQYDNKEQIRSTIERLFYSPVNLLGSHYEVSLTNSNPLLHTSRLYSMWKDYHEGIVYERQPQFYYDWTDETSQLLIAMDEEFQRLCEKFPIRKGAIPPLLEYYESTDAASMTRKITSIPAFAGLLTPMIAVDGGYIPDFTSRYFTEDFPYGLKIIHDLAHENNVDAPMIDKVYEWGMSKIKKMNAYCDLNEENRNGYLVTKEMKQLWNIQLTMLVKLLEVCKNHNLMISVDSGTMLGAVRHKGYIPWDDDIDVAMPRNDYDKLLKIASSEFDHPFFFQCPYTIVR